MRSFHIFLFSCFAAMLGAAVLHAVPVRADDRIVTIGTAGVTGVYYPAGGAICRLVNRGRKEHGIRCTVESTGGSIDNIDTLRAGDLDFGIVQSDWQYHAVKGDSVFAEFGPYTKLRSVFSLHSEALTVLVRADSSIMKFDDLKGKRVNMGNPGSGARATMEELMAQKGWSRNDFSKASEMRVSEQGRALCEKKVDAIVFSGGNPNGAIQDVTSACAARLITIDGPDIDAMVKDSPFYVHTVIPGGMYAGNPSDVKTIGMKATLVTSADTDPNIVYQLVQAVFSNFDNFKTLHPVFSTLEQDRMLTDGNIAPLHEGALRYYRERGWITTGEGESLAPSKRVSRH